MSTEQPDRFEVAARLYDVPVEIVRAGNDPLISIDQAITGEGFPSDEKTRQRMRLWGQDS